MGEVADAEEDERDDSKEEDAELAGDADTAGDDTSGVALTVAEAVCVGVDDTVGTASFVCAGVDVAAVTARGGVTNAGFGMVCLSAVARALADVDPVAELAPVRPGPAGGVANMSGSFVAPSRERERELVVVVFVSSSMAYLNR